MKDTCSDCHLWVPLSDRIRYDKEVKMDKVKKEPKPYLIVKKNVIFSILSVSFFSILPKKCQ